MKVWKFLGLAVSAILISGCVTPSKGKQVDFSISDAYVQAIGAGAKDAGKRLQKDLKMGEAYGYTRPYIPIVLPAEVEKVWIPAHKAREDEDCLVGGHWIFIKVRPSSWFIEKQKGQGQGKIRIPTMDVPALGVKETGEKN